MSSHAEEALTIGILFITSHADQMPIINVHQHTAQRGWQFIGHIVRIVLLSGISITASSLTGELSCWFLALVNGSSM